MHHGDGHHDHHDHHSHHNQDLDVLGARLSRACRAAMEEIEDRQARIRVHLEQVAEERLELGAARHELNHESHTLGRQEGELNEKLAELASLRVSIAGSSGRWCCCSRPERNGELDLGGDHVMARASAVHVIHIKGAGSHELNGSYVRMQDDSIASMWVFKMGHGPDSKMLYFSDGRHEGLPPAWYIADHARRGIYWRKHTEEETLPFAGWEVFDSSADAHAGRWPPPLLEVES